MNELPSIKSHPVVVPIIAVAFFLAYTIVCLAGGWWLRMQLESRAELAVVLDDSEFMQNLEAQIDEWTGEFNERQERFYTDNPEVPDCLAVPMPSHYHDNDYGLYPTREQEE